MQNSVHKKRKKKKKFTVTSITKFLFITTQISALIWVSISYGIALYSTIKLEQPFPVSDLSSQAVITILGESFLKVLENVFEHNSGGIFGESTKGEGS